MLACKADDLTWALAGADVAEPARVGAAMQARMMAAASARRDGIALLRSTLKI